MSVISARLIPLHGLSGEENMAADQALLESVDLTARPVLRFYTWTQPTLSLGYFQRQIDRGEHADSQTIACVRRATGGGAIVHHHELTYSLIVPNEASAAGPRLDLYQATHRCLVQALSEFGVRAAPFRSLAGQPRQGAPDPFLCFQRRTDEDLIVSGYKVVGSAQRKSRLSVLQHGSVLLQASRWAPQLPGVTDLTSRTVSIHDLAECFAGHLASVLSIRWQRDDFSDQERQRTGEVVREKFGSERWLMRR